MKENCNSDLSEIDRNFQLSEQQLKDKDLWSQIKGLRKFIH